MLMKTGHLRRAAVLTIGIGTSLSVAAQQPPSSAVRLSSPETIHVRLTLDDAIYAAQNQSIAAMVAKYTFLSAYWSFLSFQASRLPSLNLSTSQDVNYTPWPQQGRATVADGYVQSSVDKVYYNRSYSLMGNWTEWTGNKNRNKVLLHK